MDKVQVDPNIVSAKADRLENPAANWRSLIGSKNEESVYKSLYEAFLSKNNLQAQENIFRSLFDKAIQEWKERGGKIEGCKMCETMLFNQLLSLSLSEMENNGANLSAKIGLFIQWQKMDEKLLSLAVEKHNLPSAFPIARGQMSRAIRESLLLFKDYLAEEKIGYLAEMVISYGSDKARCEQLQSMGDQARTNALLDYLRNFGGKLRWEE